MNTVRQRPQSRLNDKNRGAIRRRVQIQLLLSQLVALRRELRETLHAYKARLEISLAESINRVTALRATKRVPREQMDQVDKLIMLVKDRRLKPEKGRRKDLRKVRKLITDIRATLSDSSR